LRVQALRQFGLGRGKSGFSCLTFGPRQAAAPQFEPQFVDMIFEV